MHNVSIIIPTLNRCEVLTRNLTSYLSQKEVTEVIIVNDGSTDGTSVMLENFPSKHHKKIVEIRNNCCLGAMRSRLIGVQSAKEELILFGEDDAFIEENYVGKLLQHWKNKRILAGQIIYLRAGETWEQSLQRIQRLPALNQKNIFSWDMMATMFSQRISEVLKVPFTHSLYLTQKGDFLDNVGSVEMNKGNGYREESESQVRMGEGGSEVIMLPNVYCFHLHSQDIDGGGQKRNRRIVLYWSIRNTFIFLRIHHNFFKRWPGYRHHWSIGGLTFALFQINHLLLKPIGFKLKLLDSAYNWRFFGKKA